MVGNRDWHCHRMEEYREERGEVSRISRAIIEVLLPSHEWGCVPLDDEDLTGIREAGRVEWTNVVEAMWEQDWKPCMYVSMGTGYSDLEGPFRKEDHGVREHRLAPARFLLFSPIAVVFAHYRWTGIAAFPYIPLFARASSISSGVISATPFSRA